MNHPGNLDVRHLRRAVIMAAVLAVVAVAAGAALGFRAWWVAPCNSGGGSIAPPGPEASPEQVVRTFFAAINDGDERTIEAMIAPQSREALLSEPSNDEIWISYVSNICRATNLVVRDTAPPSTDLGYPQVAAVIGDYDVELKHSGNMDANGPVVLEFWLVRESSNEPWLILNKGHP